MLTFIFVMHVVFFSKSESVQVLLFVYIGIIVENPIINRAGLGSHKTGLTPTHLCACRKSKPYV